MVAVKNANIDGAGGNMVAVAADSARNQQSEGGN